MAVTWSFMPADAALSVARRVETIRQCQEYITATVERYEGSQPFAAELEKYGVAKVVTRIIANALPSWSRKPELASIVAKGGKP